MITIERIIYFSDSDKCEKLSLKQKCLKNWKSIDPVLCLEEIQGPAFPVKEGRDYEVIAYHQGSVVSGNFKLTKKGIKIDKKHPPPVHPELVNK